MEEADVYLNMYIDKNKKLENLFSDNFFILPELMITVLSELGFEIFNIKLIESLISHYHCLSYYELKSFGFSNDQIYSLFYLIDPENEFFKRETNEIVNINETIECAICLNSAKKNVVQLPCHHIFHLKCISKWKCTCPCCRRPFKNVYQYPKLIKNWICQRANAIDILNLIKEKCNIKCKIRK